MAHSLSHNIVNGTVPDADEVMDNFNDLLGIANGVFAVGMTSGSSATARKTVGTNTNTLTGSSQTFSVPVSSLLVMSYSGKAVYANDGTGSFSVSLGILVDGASSLGLSTFAEDLDGPSGDAVTRTVPLSGTQIIGLSAGAHTIALQYVATVTTSSTGLAGIGVQGQLGYWSGIVVPVVP